MDIDSQIDEAISILQHEYGSRFNGIAADRVAAEIRQQHQTKLPSEFTQPFARLSGKLAQIISGISILARDYFRLAKGQETASIYKSGSEVHLN